MKSSKAAFCAVVGALMLLFAPAAHAQVNEWKMDPLMSQVSYIPEATDLQDADRREMTCLSLAIYQEARGESLQGMRAVGHVIMNRTRDRRFPSTICGAVWQRSQFSWTVRPVMGILPRDDRQWRNAQQVALDLMAGRDTDLTNGANHFYNSRTDRPSWSGRGVRTLVVGVHIFRRL